MITDYIARWRFDGNLTADHGGVNGTGVGTPTFSAGQIGQGVALNGASQYFHFGDNFGFDITDPFSYGVWIKPASATPSADMQIMNKILLGGNFPGQVFSLNGAQSGDPFEAVILSTSTGQFIQIRFTHTNSTNWAHLILTYDGSTNASGLKCYKDGVELTSRTIVSDTLDNGSSEHNTGFYCGALSDGSSKFNGMFDDMRIYDRELSPSDCAELAAYDGDLNLVAVESYYYNSRRAA